LEAIPQSELTQSCRFAILVYQGQSMMGSSTPQAPALAVLTCPAPQRVLIRSLSFSATPTFC